MNGPIDLNQAAQAKMFKQMEIAATKEIATRAQDLQSEQNVAQLCVNLLVNGDKTPDLPFVPDAHKAAAQFLTAYFAQASERLTHAAPQLAPEESFVRV